MEIDQYELFQKLLDQLAWHPDSAQKLLKQTAIAKVLIHQKSKRWDFCLNCPQIWSYQLFAEFAQRLQAAFESIAKVKIRFKTTDQNNLSNQLLADYWKWVIGHAGINSPLLQELFNHNVPYIEDGRVLILADNEIIKDFLVNQALGPIEAGYQDLGFPKFAIHTMVDQSKSQQKIEEFKQRQEKSDEALAQKALAAIHQQSQQKNKPTVAPIKENGLVVLGKRIDNEPTMQLSEIDQEERSVIVQGYIFDKEVRTLRSSRQLLILKITDYSSSIVVKKFSRNDDDEAAFAALAEGQWIKVRGNVQEDNFLHDLVINAYDINQVTHRKRQDTKPEGEKRIELHLHTNMSTMDATNSITDYVKQAAAWGQSAIAVTDHSDLQAFPEAHAAGEKYGVKILYGVEINLVDDGMPIAYNQQHVNLDDATYVIFDTETTGLSARYDKVIELAAVKMHHGAEIDSFEEFIDPGHPLSKTTIELTSITDEMVNGSKSEKEVFQLFQKFCQGCIIVGHNATFDVDFMNTGYQRHQLPMISEPWLDTLPMARLLYPQLKSFRLNKLTKLLDVKLEHHHRAIYDARATGYVYFAMLEAAQKRFKIHFQDEFNQHIGQSAAYQHEHPYHATLLAANQGGLKNLFKLVSDSMINYFYRVPRVPRSLLTKYRQGLLVGSACASGEVFTAMMQKGYDEAKRRAQFYDYLEVQPKPLYQPLLDQELVKNETDLEEIIQNLIQLGQDLRIPVAATGDVHYLNQEDAIYRKILINSQGGANPLNRLPELPDAHFRTTDEMLQDFAFLGENEAKKVVVAGPAEISAKIDVVSPVKDKLYTPKMPGAEDQIHDLTLNKAHELYGDPLPEIVQKRLEKELKSVIGNGFSVIYLIAQKLVYKSNKDGYLVGSRGSVGSSLVATMTGITEVNPLPPHYRCPKCKWSHFYVKGEYGSGYDLPAKKCPKCQTLLIKDGQDIPFETFLGFYGNKVPDIDLNFSGDYQPIAHNYTKVLFGENNVYRAGTIGTVADKTAYGYVKGYERDTEQEFRNAEVDRLAKGATGVKRTTGQHPAGILVVPDYMDIFDFTPIQYPADDQTATWKTTHFDFHSIHDNILKLDILGHDDPTMIRMLQDLSGINPKSIPPADPGVMQLFSGTEVLGVTPEQIGSKTGTLGIPEFGTRFVRGMLEETKPKTFAELLKISGLSHGTDVWLGNAEELIQNGTVTMPEVIGCRDDIMMDLIHMGVEADRAFKIMEHVRKGRGIPEDWQKEMRQAKVPEWYINSCLKIKYMFPKAHAAAYVLMALRIAYFKVYFPLIYYAAYFSVRADDFDLVAMTCGKETVKAAIKEINAKGMDASTKEKNLLTVLELANEMLERGFNFKMVDLDRSAVSAWLIDDDSLIAPFNAIPGLGTNVAKQIVAAREEKPFLSKEDLAKRGKVSKTLIDFMDENHVLDKLPDENQLSLFDSLF